MASQSMRSASSKGSETMHKIFHMLKFFILMFIAGGFGYYATDLWARYLFGFVGVMSVLFILAELAGYGELRN